jgi:hypothetical protein
MYLSEAELGSNYRRVVRQHHQPKESIMNKIEDRRTAQSSQETTGPSNIRKSPSLHLDTQIIRTLTGAELKIVGGGKRACPNSDPH